MIKFWTIHKIKKSFLHIALKYISNEIFPQLCIKWENPQGHIIRGIKYFMCTSSSWPNLELFTEDPYYLISSFISISIGDR